MSLVAPVCMSFFMPLRGVEGRKKSERTRNGSGCECQISK
uniref:Uncharacterized protein n=1 Tax=Anguilla anguilla TaxID=7936 RepID=A0A0E9SKA0_ANGAN